MSNNEARWAMQGKIRPAASFVLWAIALVLTGAAVVAQVEMATKAALTVAEKAESSGVTYLAVVFSFCAMAFAWWQSRAKDIMAHESQVAAVETARSLQRLCDLLDGEVKPQMQTEVDESVDRLLKLRRKHDRRSEG